MSEQETSSGFGKAIMIFLILAVLGIAVVGAAGTIIYLNWDKIVSKDQIVEAPDESGSLIPTQALAKLAAGYSPTSSGSAAPAAPTARRPVVASAPIAATENSYRTWMGRDDVLVMVDYYADWCGPCRKIAPSLSKLAATHGDKVVVLKVNVDNQKSLARAAGIRSIPDVRLMHAGKQLERVIGGRDYAYFESIVRKHASRLPKPTGGTAAPARSAPSGGSITPLKKDWLPPGVSPAGS